jgi:hypothetical protein
MTIRLFFDASLLHCPHVTEDEALRRRFSFVGLRLGVESSPGSQ